MKRINRRQFIIAKAKYYGDDFVQERLNDNYYLSYQRELDIQHVDDTFLIGKAFSCIQRGKVELNNALTHMYEWAGRWVLITDNMLFLDACGTLGVFYLKDNEGNIICSSSLKLIEEMFPEVKFKADHRIRRHDFRYFDFYPGPYTPVEGVMSLLPSQFIDFKKNMIRIRNDINFQRYEKQNKYKLLKKIVDAEAAILKNISEEYADEIWLPLTGGVDSRTIFAIANYAGIKFNTYTISRSDTDPWDITIPQKLSDKCNITHHIYKDRYTGKKVKDEQLDEIIQHCGGATTDGTEIGQYLSGIDVPVKNKAIVLWGTIWEVTCHFYRREISDVDRRIKDKEKILSIINGLSNNSLEKSEVHKKSFEYWVDYIIENPVLGMDWVDRLYWEQRVASWVKYSSQVYDMFDSDRVAPANCQYVIEMMLSFRDDANIKKDKKLQKSMIDFACPQIKDIHYGKAFFAYKVLKHLKNL